MCVIMDAIKKLWWNIYYYSGDINSFQGNALACIPRNHQTPIEEEYWPRINSLISRVY